MPESGVPAIRARGLVKEFGQGDTRIRVLHEVDLDIARGLMTFLVGPSGCGKTTLISVLAGILTAEAGTIEVMGEALERLRGPALPRFRSHRIGFVFQQFNLLPALTAAENAAVPLLIQGMGETAAVRRAASLLDRLGLEGQADKLPAQLSGGQQQRVAIARALVHEPDLLVCDEPTASLDAGSGHAVMQRLRKLAISPDRAAIVVTHDNRIFGFADRIVHMADGRITATQDGNVQEEAA